MMIEWLFGWSKQSVMEATFADEVKGFAVIIIVGALIWLIGWISEKLTDKINKWLNKKGWHK